MVWDPVFFDFYITDFKESRYLLNDEFREFLRDEHELHVLMGLAGSCPRPPWAPRVLDLFSGAGGFSLGFAEAYHDDRMKLLNKNYRRPEDKQYLRMKKRHRKNAPWGSWLVHPNMDEDAPEIIGVELSKDACRTYQMNRVGQAIRADVRHLPFRQLRGLFDIIIGGPPCRPFSSLNRIRRGDKHHEHDLVAWFFYWCAFYEPQVFVMENVPGIVNDAVYGPMLKELSKKVESTHLTRYSDEELAEIFAEA